MVKKTKKKAAAKKTTPTLSKPETEKKAEPYAGEQLKFSFLKDSKETRAILEVAIAYKAAVKARQGALADEVDKKNDLLSLIHELKIKPMPDGIIRIEINDTKISVTPRDELIKVKLSDAELAE